MTRVRIEALLSAIFAATAILTSFWPDWIEVFGWDPDHGDGSLEWALVAAFGVLAVIAALLARRGLRRLRTS
jgi:hypothetical protein